MTSPTETRRPAAPRRRPRDTLAACAVAYALVILGTTVVNVALPSIRADLGGSTAALQWVINAYLLLLASLLLTMGALCDVAGARRMMLGGLALFAGGGVVAAVAPDLDVLVAAQVVLGAAAAALIPASLALITHTYRDERERAHAIGVWASASAAAVAAGPVVGGLLIAAIGWRATFAVDVPVALAIFCLIATRVDETPRRPSAGVDAPGQLAGIVSLSALTFALIETGRLGWGAPLVLGELAVAAAAGAAFLVVERRTGSPMLPLELLASRRFDAGAAVGTLFSFSVYGQLFVLSLYLQEARGLSALATGLVFLAQPATYALVALRTGRLVERFGARGPTAAGSALACAGAALLLAVGPATPLALVVVALSLSGLGAALVIPVATAEVVADAPRSRAGVAAAAYNAARNSGGVLGIAVVGGMVGRGSFVGDLHVAAATCAAALALGAAACIAFAGPAGPASEEPLEPLPGET